MVIWSAYRTRPKGEETYDKDKKESEKGGLKLNIQKMKIMATGPITSWQLEGEKLETDRYYFLGLRNHCRWWLQPRN